MYILQLQALLYLFFYSSVIVICLRMAFFNKYLVKYEGLVPAPISSRGLDTLECIFSHFFSHLKCELIQDRHFFQEQIFQIFRHDFSNFRERSFFFQNVYAPLLYQVNIKKIILDTIFLSYRQFNGHFLMDWTWRDIKIPSVGVCNSYVLQVSKPFHILEKHQTGSTK